MAAIGEHGRDCEAIDDLLLKHKRHALFDRHPGNSKRLGWIRNEGSALFNKLTVENRGQIFDVIQTGTKTEQWPEVSAEEARLLQALPLCRFDRHLPLIHSTTWNLPGYSINQKAVLCGEQDFSLRHRNDPGSGAELHDIIVLRKITELSTHV